MTHLQVDPPSYLKTPPLGGTLPSSVMWTRSPVRWVISTRFRKRYATSLPDKCLCPQNYWSRSSEMTQ